MTKAEDHFRKTVPKYMRKLLSDFPNLSVDDAAAIFGNAGHESAGLTTLQEIKPTVAGSRGGWGWMQWTGPRRRAFEAYAKRTGKSLYDDDTNYDYLFLELKGVEGTESNAVPATIKAKCLDAKVEAFEKSFLRAGVKHYDQRKKWAKIALEAYTATYNGKEKPVEVWQPDLEPNKGLSLPALVFIVIAAIAAAILFFFVPIGG